MKSFKSINVILISSIDDDDDYDDDLDDGYEALMTSTFSCSIPIDPNP